MGVGRDIKAKWIANPLPPAGSFKDQRILVTGGTSGLGLAFAVHVINLGAREVIITARNQARGADAREKIESATRTSGKITVLDLEMDSYSSIVSFAEQLKGRYSTAGGLDFIVFNAGITNPAYVKSRTGWEESLQINAISTGLLALLLLPWMKALSDQRQTPAHMTFVGTGQHTTPNIQDWLEWADKEGGVLAHFNKPENWPTYHINAMYGINKLVLMYATNEMCKMVLGPSGEPQVIINTVCPGLVSTNLSRSMEAHSVALKVISPLFKAILSKSPDFGARIYLAAGLTGKEGHGKFLTFYLTDEEYEARAAPIFKTDAGRRVQGLVWKELVDVLGAEVPEVKQIVASLAG